MKPLHPVARATLCGALSMLAGAATHAELGANATARLQALSAAPTLAGDLIYQGQTFAQGGTGTEPLFHYERRLRATPGVLVATHLTRDAAGRLLITDEAQFNAAYQLQGLTVLNQQQGYSAEVRVSSDGRRLHYRLIDGGALSTAEESIDRPAVSGPSLFGFILAHASALDAARVLPVCFVVPKDKRCYGFDIRKESAAPGQAVYAMTPSAWWLRPFIATMRVVVDASAPRIVRYEGRVPPMQTVAGKLADLDARVEYTAVAVVYR